MLMTVDVPDAVFPVLMDFARQRGVLPDKLLQWFVRDLCGHRPADYSPTHAFLWWSSCTICDAQDKQ